MAGFNKSDLEVIIDKLTSLENTIFAEVQLQLDTFKHDIKDLIDFHNKEITKNIENYYRHIREVLDEHKFTLKKHEEQLNAHEFKILKNGNDIEDLKKNIVDIKEGNDLFPKIKRNVIIASVIAVVYLALNLLISLSGKFW